MADFTGSNLRSPIPPIFKILQAVTLVALTVMIVTAAAAIFPDPGWFTPRPITVVMPMPYRIPAQRGMADLRLAMIHDVVCERYVRHGSARDQALKAAADGRIAQDPGDLAAYDDSALASERLGDQPTARRVLEVKAHRQGLTIPKHRSGNISERLLAITNPSQQPIVSAESPPLDQPALQRYRTFANLGTILIHGGMPILAKAARDSEPRQAALEDIRVGLSCLYEAVRINQAAHFGRELWQIVIVEHLLHAAEDPTWLRRFDAIGNPLPALESGSMVSNHYGWGLTAERLGTSQGYDARFSLMHPLADVDKRLSPSERAEIRSHITTVGANGVWCAAIPGTLQSPVPFDQPVLGILGMWTLGGGANPHFALSLGTVMERVGQGTLAWVCYERASDMVERFSPDPETRLWFQAHLRTRQEMIAGTRGGAAWETVQRVEFRRELSWALQQREEFQQAEAQRLITVLAAGGGSVLDPEADARFWAARPPLASPVGTTDDFHGRLPTRSAKQHLTTLAYGFIAVAVWAFIAVARRRYRLTRELTPD